MSKTHSKSQLRQNYTFETKSSLRSFLSHNFVKDLFQCTIWLRLILSQHLKTNSEDIIMSKTLFYVTL